MKEINNEVLGQEVFYLFDRYVHSKINRHGFHNNTTPRYNEEAAQLAWQRTIAFFDETLR